MKYLIAAPAMLASLLAAPIAAQQAQGRVADRAGAQHVKPVERNDELQPSVLPPLPAGMALADIRDGDTLFHGKGGCFVCHGVEAQGMPAAGDAITVGLAFIQPEWDAIDSLITAGIPDALTRSPIAMPPRGAKSNLSSADTRRLAAYVWAISHVRGEPWPGGHESHARLEPMAATTGTVPQAAHTP